jgi:ligand-binding sensor domain-containing protein
VEKANGLPRDDNRKIVVDRDNNIWVGTSNGIAIILDSSNPTRPGWIASYRPLNGLVINTVEIDPLNQKCIGTTEGVVLVSSDGTQRFASYTVACTGGKLIDDDVKSIAIDKKTRYVYFGTACGLASFSTTASWIGERQPAPSEFSLSQNYAKPFNRSTWISYLLPKRLYVTLSVYNTLGHQVAQLMNGEVEAGHHEVKFDGSGLSSGVYFYRLQAGDFVQTRKLLILR